MPVRPKPLRQALLRTPFPSLSRYRACQPPYTPRKGAAQFSQAAVAPSPPPEAQIEGRDEFWRRIPIWQHVSAADFTSWAWSTRNVVEHHLRSKDDHLRRTLATVLPDSVPYDRDGISRQSREELINDVFDGLSRSSMSLRIMPHVFSRINWDDPRHDPIFRQFIPLGSIIEPDHPQSGLDSLSESSDSPVNGIVHRYPDKALFLPIAVCPTYCNYCTRAHNVGADTEEVKKQKMLPTLARWEKALHYLETHPQIVDVVVSGGDAYYLTPKQLLYIGQHLIRIPSIKKFRFASKGLAVAPNRILDPDDPWAEALIWVHRWALEAGKRMALHTHFNHAGEISWMTELASRKLVEAGVTIRNQTVLLRGVNDNVAAMSKLIRTLADDLRITPYYVYQCDMVRNIEHLRTPLQTIIDLEAHIRGSIAGFDTPQFIVDLPGGGGKRLAGSYVSYDRREGSSEFLAPAVSGAGQEGKTYTYYDPIRRQPSQAQGASDGFDGGRNRDTGHAAVPACPGGGEVV